MWQERKWNSTQVQRIYTWANTVCTLNSNGFTIILEPASLFTLIQFCALIGKDSNLRTFFKNVLFFDWLIRGSYEAAAIRTLQEALTKPAWLDKVCMGSSQTSGKELHTKYLVHISSNIKKRQILTSLKINKTISWLTQVCKLNMQDLPYQSPSQCWFSVHWIHSKSNSVLEFFVITS